MALKAATHSQASQRKCCGGKGRDDRIESQGPTWGGMNLDGIGAKICQRQSDLSGIKPMLMFFDQAPWTGGQASTTSIAAFSDNSSR